MVMHLVRSSQLKKVSPYLLDNFSLSQKSQIILMKRVFRFFFRVFLFLILTVLTQIGGLVYALALLVSRLFQFKYKNSLCFIALYLLFTFGIIPWLAPLFGREKVNHTNVIQPTNYITVLLNRNYVVPSLNKVLSKVSDEVQEQGVQLNYLDANFPFYNGFPLLPHLSHNDGKKIDLSLVYQNSKGQISKHQKSFLGYGVFVEPLSIEYDQTEVCKNLGYFQYDYPKYLSLGRLNQELQFSEKGTRQLVQSFLKQPQVGKLFIEPHLKTRLNLRSSKVRFHGCRAVRHDDHIHVQLN